MTGIIGSGFGLYGYVPAVLLVEDGVALLERARPKFLERTELLQYSTKIQWYSDFEYFLKSINVIIISVPPNEQVKILEHCLQFDNLNKLILEKPIAPDPETSITMLNQLIKANKDFRIGYSFLYTTWYEALRKSFVKIRTSGNIVVNIKWHFKAHHYKEKLQNWKRSRKQGGGVLRYYGIHVIAILTDLKLIKILSSQMDCFSFDDGFRWSFNCCDIFDNEGRIEIDTNSNHEEFIINIVNSNDEKVEYYSFKSKSPFETESSVHNDQRIEPLKRLYLDLISQSMDESDKDFYKKVNYFWAEIESKSKLNENFETL